MEGLAVISRVGGVAPTDKPVIFVPGIMGSVMKGPSAFGITQYWTNLAPTGNPNIPSVKNLTLNQSSNYYQNGIFPTDTIRSILGQPF